MMIAIEPAGYGQGFRLLQLDKRTVARMIEYEYLIVEEMAGRRFIRTDLLEKSVAKDNEVNALKYGPDFTPITVQRWVDQVSG
jgi:hypothetical protein